MASMQVSSVLPLYEDMSTILATNELSTSKEQSNMIITQQSPALLGQLNHRIQALNLNAPLWNIQIESGTERGIQRFIGTLTIDLRSGEEIVVSSVESEPSLLSIGLPSKKDVKAVLARKALVLLEGLSPSLKASAGSAVNTITSPANDSDGTNWIGRILEYNNSIPMQHRMLTYTESSVTPFNRSGPALFTCVLSIAVPTSVIGMEGQPSSPYTACNFPLSDTSGLFASKKLAKLHCSRAAGEALILMKLLLQDGSLPPKKVVMPPQPQRSNEPSSLVDIPRLCIELGLPPVRYDFTSPSGDPNNSFVDCSASFPPTTGLPAPLAIVHNVYGKKMAKEACAKVLLERLSKVREWRLRGGGAWTD